MRVNEPTGTRWASALAILGWVERQVSTPSALRRRTYRIEGPHAVRDGIAPNDLQRPIRPMARQVAPDAEHVEARCRADVVRVGKFDIEEIVRFRAFHCIEVDQPSALRVQGHVGRHDPGVERDVEVRREVARVVPELAPNLYEYRINRRRRVAYLREEVVVGRHPRNAREVQKLLPDLVAGMARLYRGHGVTSTRLSNVVSEQLPQRWEQVVEAGLVTDAVGAAVRALVARDALVEISLGHGDLVRTNLVVTGDGVVLVDWEHAATMPIAFDLAKPVLLVADREEGLQVVARALGGVVAPSRDSYTFEEQLALALAQMLSWTAHRAQRAAAAGRAELFEVASRERSALLAWLLEAEEHEPRQ